MVKFRLDFSFFFFFFFKCSQFEGFYLAKSNKENVYIKRGVDVNLAHFVPTFNAGPKP